jgi:glycosyltransferase involved in cell wall biosynthesis
LYKVAVICDSPKLHTGFGVVGKNFCQSLHDAGFDVHVFGLLDTEDDDEGVLPYTFNPVPPMDLLGHRTFSMFLRAVKPDVIFISTDPGNRHAYLYDMDKRGVADYKRGKKFYRPTVVSYTPIEGYPAPLVHGDAIMAVEQAFGGRAVVYCHSAREMLCRQFPQIEKPPEVVFHGLDHANFRKYDEEDRKLIRGLTGLNEFFVVGSVGINKRTKGFPAIIYTAVVLRENGYDKDVKFYCHTNPLQETMEGYKLRDIAEYHGVDDMFLWKQKIHEQYYLGLDWENNSLEKCRKMAGEEIESAEERGLLFTLFDMPTMYNCFDLYLDLSQVEGWNLPLGEAMACGVPAISLRDQHVREEIYSQGAYMLDPLPRRMWDTWHSGMRLVNVDPLVVAEAIVKMKKDEVLRAEYSARGRYATSKYKWWLEGEKLVKIVKETTERYIKEWEES